MKKNVLVILLLLSMFSLTFASAALTLSPPEEVYNLGDWMYVTADGILGVNSGNFKIDLVCGPTIINFVKFPARVFDSSEPQSWAIPYKILNEDDLEIEDISTILGSCQVVSSIGSEVATTDSFEISNNIIVQATLDKDSYDPGEEIIISISATKANGDPLTGVVDVKNATSFEKAIEDGFVSEVFSMPENSESGSYGIVVEAYDTGKEGKLNSGTTVIYFDINQIPTSVVSSISETQITPGEEITLGGQIFDQSGKEIPATISLQLISPNGEVHSLEVVSGKFVSYLFDFNASVGEWVVVSEYNSIIEEREFEVIGLQKAEVSFEGPILIVKNIGNIDYTKPLLVTFNGEEVAIEDVFIGVGKTKRFSLEAPEGEYAITVSDGSEQELSSQSLALTGKAISVESIREGSFLGNKFFLWTIIIIILGAISVWLFTKEGSSSKKIDVHDSVFSRAKRFIPFAHGRENENLMVHHNKGPEEKKGFGLMSRLSSKKETSPVGNHVVDFTKSNRGVAESSLVLKGEKQKSAVVCLKIYNEKEISTNAVSRLHALVMEAAGSKGKVDFKDEYAFIIFSPLFTKTYGNEILASKAGFELFKKINEQNKKFKDTIEFSIGAHSGELISAKEKENLKYTSIGNTMALSKKITDHAKGKFLVSEDIRKKLMRDLKVTKESDIGKTPVFSVSEIKNKEANEAKLKDLLKRM